MPARRPEREAERLLERTGLRAVPVRVDVVAKKLGVEISEQPLEDSISGLLYRDGERTVIGVNKAQPPARRRFTLGHELGHLVMHPGRPLVLDSSIRVNWRDDAAAGSDREEVEANAFAAALLMPADLVRAEIEQLLREPEAARTKTLEKVVKQLARRFRVSEQAMHFRLLGLGLQLSS